MILTVYNNNFLCKPEVYHVEDTARTVKSTRKGPRHRLQPAPLLPNYGTSSLGSTIPRAHTARCKHIPSADPKSAAITQSDLFNRYFEEITIIAADLPKSKTQTPSHLGHKLFQFLPSGRRRRWKSAKTEMRTVSVPPTGLDDQGCCLSLKFYTLNKTLLQPQRELC